MKKKIHIDDVWRGFVWAVLLAFLFGGAFELGRMIFYPRPEYATYIRQITKDPTLRRRNGKNRTGLDSVSSEVDAISLHKEEKN